MKRLDLGSILLLLTLLGGMALRLYRLGADSLWYDETVSLLLARSDLAELIRHTAADIHPPFYYLLLHFWGRLAGWSEFSAAFLSLWFGVLLIALVYRVARDWLAPLARRLGIAPRTAALLAAFLVAISPYNVWYSQEVRMYTLGAALGLASMYFWRRLVRRNTFLAQEGVRGSAGSHSGSRFDWAGYVLVTAIGLYTLYYFIFLVAFEYFYASVCLLRALAPTPTLPPYATLQGPAARMAGEGESAPTPTLPRHTGEGVKGSPRAIVFSFLTTQLMLALIYLPWLPVAFRQATDPPVPPWRSFTALPQMLIESFSALALGQSVEPLTVALLLIGVIVLILLLFAQLIRSRSHLGIGLFLLGYSLVPLLLIYGLSFWTPLYHVRYVFTYSPAFYMLFALAIVAGARALARGSPRSLAVLALGLVLVVMLGSAYSLYNFWNDPRYATDDLRGAVRHLAENWRPGDAILVDAGYAYPALEYYYPEAGLKPVRLSNYQPAPNDADAAPLVLQAGSIGGSARLGWNDPRSDFYATTAAETQAALERVFRSHARIWILRIYDTVVDPGGDIRRYFGDHARLIDEQAYSGESNARVLGYLTADLRTLPPDATRRDVHLADRVALLGQRLSTTRLKPGGSLDVMLYWQPLQTLNYNYKRSLQVLDARGRVVAQEDVTPLGTELGASRWKVGEVYPDPARVALPAELSAGHYSIVVKLYNPNTGEVLGEPTEVDGLDIPN